VNNNYYQHNKELKMNKLFNIVFIAALTFSACSKTPVVELPITTSSPKALEFYKKAMLSEQVGDGFEKRQYLDSALALDLNFVMALEMYGSQDPIKLREQREMAKSLQNTVTDAEQLMLNIRNAYRDGNMDHALENAKKLVENYSDAYESYVWLGQAQSDRYELDDAIKTLKKSIELNPDSYNAYSLLMGHHISAGTQVMLPEEKRDIELGMKYGDELIRIRGDHGFPYHFKANVYRQLGEFEKAKPLYEKSIQKRKGLSSEATAYLVSGHNFMFGGDLKTARERYAKAVELTKTADDWFSLNFYLLVSYMFDNDYIGAIEHIDKIEHALQSKGFDEVSLLGRKATIHWQKMVCYAHNQMEEDAYNALEQGSAFSERRAGLLNDENTWRGVRSDRLFDTAWVNILFGKYEDAKKNLARLKEMQEKRNDPTAMYGYYGLMGMTHLMEGNHQEAVDNFKKGNENNIYFNYFKGLSLRAAGQEEQAIKTFQDLAKINFSNWNIAIVKRLAQKQLSGV
jgi:tetratricopeptide (TPR) repeat protein|tara:strand:- start:2704 stop:4245 length:1542 start_codon:yes stop_codon:yes gene_type:complete